MKGRVLVREICSFASSLVLSKLGVWLSRGWGVLLSVARPCSISDEDVLVGRYAHCSIRLRGYSVSGMKSSSSRKSTPKRIALNQLIQAALTRLRKPPTELSALYHRLFIRI